MITAIRYGVLGFFFLFLAACDHAIEEPTIDVGTYHITSVQVKNDEGSKAPKRVLAAIDRNLTKGLVNNSKDGRAVVLRVWIDGYSNGKTWRKDWLSGSTRIAVRGNLHDEAAGKAEGAFKYNVETVGKETKLYSAITEEKRSAARLLENHVIEQATSRTRLNLP